MCEREGPAPLWSNSRTPFRHSKRYKRRDQSKSRLSDLQRVPTIGQYVLANACDSAVEVWAHYSFVLCAVCQTRSRRAVIVFAECLDVLAPEHDSEELGAKAA